MLDLQQPYNQLSEHDEITLKRLVDDCSGIFFCEVGCWTGHSTSILAARAKEAKALLIVVDDFMGNDGTPLEEYARDNNVKQIFLNNMLELGLMDSICLFDESSFDAYKKIADGSLSFLFIDAGHSYEDIKRDLTNYLPKMKKDGLICGHDYESETYDERYIGEDYVDGKHHGVIKAVNEVLGKVEHEGRMWWLRLNNS